MKECIKLQSSEEHNYILAYNLQYFAQDGEGGEKTEPATSKKLKDARQEGKVAKSKELTAGFSLIALFLCLKIFVSFVSDNFLGMFSAVYDRFSEFTHSNQLGFSSQSLAFFFQNVILQWMLSVLPFFVVGFVIAFLVTLIQVGWTVSAKPMQPKLSKFNPISGFKRIFSKESLFNLLLSIVKIAAIMLIAFFSIKDKANYLFILYEISLQEAIALVGSIILDTGLKISIIYLLVGIADWIYQKFKFSNDMKMTKQEVKDEYKNTEGDPQIKGRQRQKMREASQRRMMQDVPKADVVITNPTHLAVALQYDAKVSSAPIVIAKGEDYLAQKIKEIARENGIEIVEDKPLARMLFHSVKIGEAIPPELYQAVAEILAMLYNKKNGQ